MEASKKTNKSMVKEALIALLISLFFTAYNGFLGFYYLIIFNLSMFGYYAIMAIINLVIYVKLKSRSAKSSVGNFILLHIILLILDLSLLLPIILTVTFQKTVKINPLYSLVYGAYAIFKIIRAIVKYKKYHDSSNILYAERKTISLIDALVTLMSLENILIISYYIKDTDSGKTLLLASLISGIVFVIAILTISIKDFKTGLKIIKKSRN